MDGLTAPLVPDIEDGAAIREAVEDGGVIPGHVVGVAVLGQGGDRRPFGEALAVADLTAPDPFRRLGCS